MRDLASIVTIETKNKMFEKDRLCVVTFKENGYESIIPVENNVGDNMVFIQEGSILPETERWEFLRKRCYRDDLRGFLIKPMTMGAKDLNGEKGDRVKSWGLCVTLKEAGIEKDLKAGTDVTDLLNIRKYEPAEDASPKPISIPKFIKFCLKHKLIRWIGNIYIKRKKHRNSSRGGFPTELISKSDETTIQNYKSVINSFPGKKAFITAKLEGQSFTCTLDKNAKNLILCSRNNRLLRGDSNATIFYEVADRLDIQKKLINYYKKTGQILILQGEQVGPGIQGNIYNFNENRWYLFRMKAIVSKEIIEYNYPNMLHIANELDLSCVPLLDVIDDMGQFTEVKQLVDYAEKAAWNPKNTEHLVYHISDGDKLWKTYMQHEGIVVKSEDYNKERGTGFSFKVKNLQYAEKQYTEMNALCRKMQENK